ncbi:MAG: hypothetical protein AAGC65_12395 [Mucilaginibacter sp.]|uniref:hypothetical protein n=1 Tax=Mucilaginibacter sp. TaxID=1882438 RepID=UPI0031AF918B
MKETFETFEKRSHVYKIISFAIFASITFVFSCIFFSNIISKAPQFLMVCVFLISMFVLISSMFIGGSSIKTYIINGHLILTDSSITLNQNIYFLKDLFCVETTAGRYKGLGTRGGLDDGTGNKITITTKDHIIIKTKFVVVSKTQRDNLTKLLKYWKANGYKIVSNGIDLI